MKKTRPATTLSTILFVILSLNVRAQPTHLLPQNTTIETPLGQQSLPMPLLRSAKSIADNACRLVAMAILDYNGVAYVPGDSATYKYSGTRGSQFSYNIFYCKTDTSQSYDNGSPTSPLERYAQTYDSHNNILTSTGQRWDTWISDWRNSLRGLFTYDDANNLLVDMMQTWDTSTAAWINYKKTTNTYTPANELATSVSQNWNNTTGAWIDDVRIINTYDLSNNLVTEFRESWYASYAIWDSVRLHNTYDALGNLTTQTYEFKDVTSGMWSIWSKHLYSYDGANRLIVDLLQLWDNSTGSWKNLENVIYSTYSGNNAGTIIRQNWNNTTSMFINNNRRNYTYNSFNQPIYYFSDSWDQTAGTWVLTPGGNKAKRYYYETYETSTANTVTKDHNLRVYPNPATDKLNIAVSWPTPQPFTISITDMCGRIIDTWCIGSCNRHTETFPVKDFAPGNYLLKIEGSKTKLVQRFTVD